MSAPALSATASSAQSAVRPRPFVLGRRLFTDAGMVPHFRSRTAIKKPAAGAPSGTADASYQFRTLKYPAASTYATGINDFGCIGGLYYTAAAPDQSFGFVLTPPYTNNHYRSVYYPNSGGTFVLGINNRGDTAGFYYNGQTQFGFVKSGSTYTSYADPNAPFGRPNELGGLNDRGFAVGTYIDSADNAHGFVVNLKTGTYFELVPPGAPGNNVQAIGINDLGEVVGSISSTTTGAEVAFTYKNSTYREFSFPAAIATAANGVNNFGEIVGDYSFADGKPHGFALKNGKFVTVDDVNGDNGGGSVAFGVNDFGVIVGAYQDATDQIYGFVAIRK